MLILIAMWVATLLGPFSLLASFATVAEPSVDSDPGSLEGISPVDDCHSLSFEHQLHQHLLLNPLDFWREAGNLGDKVAHHATKLFDNAAEAFASADIMNKVAVEWKEAGHLGDKVVHHATELFDSAADAFASAPEIMDEFKVAVEHTMAAVKKFEDHLRREGIDLEELSQKLNAQIIIISEQLKAEFSEPLPEERTLRQKQREIIIDSALSKLEDAVVAITALWGVSEIDARAHFQEIKPSVKKFLVISGKLLDDHPVLISTVLLTGVVLLLPKGWLFRSILDLFGFGSKGPVKGSAAAWAQSTFWGEAVEAGSWFAKLQAAAMVI